MAELTKTIKKIKYFEDRWVHVFKPVNKNSTALMCDCGAQKSMLTFE